MAVHAEISAVHIGLQTDADRAVQSWVTVRTPEMFAGKSPAYQGLYDQRMGTTDPRFPCTTCGNNARKCPGHSGVIELPFPLVLPIGIAEVRRWLRVVCLHCSALMFDPGSNDRVARAPANRKLFAAASHIGTTSGAVCPSCGAVHPKISKVDTDFYSFQMELLTKTGAVVSKIIYPYQLGRVFERISDETVAAMGKDPRMYHPRDLLQSYLQVPAVSIRPAVRMAGPGGFGSSCHDINSILQYISKASETITAGSGPVTLPAPGVEPSKALVDNIMSVQQLAFDLMIGSGASPSQRGTGKRGVVVSNRPPESLARRIPQKKGRIRRSLIGGRVWAVGRNTISGNCQLRIDQVGIPESFARSLQVVETVQANNLFRLMRFFLNGRRQYPGATRVWRAATRTQYDVDGLRDFRLEIGDVLHRDVVTGDWAIFNRAPSLERSAINAHEVVVQRDPYGDSVLPVPSLQKTFQFNVAGTPLYNADFDGDEMTLTVLARAGVLAEARYLSAVPRAFISTKTSGPVIGQVQDSTVGSFLLSQVGARLDKLRTMRLFEETYVNLQGLDFSDIGAKFLTGREAVSRLLGLYPISLVRRSTWFSSAAEPYVNYDPADTVVEISRGVLKRGVLDKATVGGSAGGGVFHRISRVYGSSDALRAVFALQQMAIAHLDARGFTISISDMIIPDKNIVAVKEIVAGMIREAEHINEQLIAGDIIPPLGMTTHRYYETLQIEALKVPDAILGPVLSALDPDTNGLLQMVGTGSKGNFKNMINIMGVIGQITIDGRRIQPGGDGRTLAYFPCGDMSPQAYGFVDDNFCDGCTASTHYFGAMNGRNDLTNKALATASTGHANRKSIMSTQSSVTDALRMVVGPGVTQLLYGGDGMDAREVEPIPFRTALLSDAAVAARFSVPELADAAWHRAELARLFADRDAYRGMFLDIEAASFNVGFPSHIHMAVDVKGIVHAACVGGPPAAPAALERMHAEVLAFCAAMPYLLLNNEQQRRRAVVADFVAAAVVQFARVVRVELSTAVLREVGADERLLQLVFDQIRIRYIRSLVPTGEAVGVLASQSVEEPTMQKLLNSHHNNDGEDGKARIISRPAEISGARGVDREAAPEMLFRGVGGDGKVSNDKAVLQEIADAVKLLNLKQITAREDRLYEAFPTDSEFDAGKPSADRADAFYPGYVSDWPWIREYLACRPVRVPENITMWCSRFVVDRLGLVMKSISLETIVTRLRVACPAAFVVHTPEVVTGLSADIVVRVYLTSDAFRRGSASKLDPKKISEAAFEALRCFPLRGIRGITDARVEKTVRHTVVPAGPDKGKLVMESDVYVVRTVGTNLHGALLHNHVDPDSLTSSSIGDTIKIFGIAAGRAKIESEVRRVMGNGCPNARHLQIYAAIMTQTGRHSAFEFGGIAERDPSNVLLRAAAHGPIAVFTQAALEGVSNANVGMAAPMMLGGVPKIGTGSVSLAVDSDFVKERFVSVAKTVRDL
jgi:DNA-directed RNA polymerase II subunit RPB1